MKEKIVTEFTIGEFNTSVKYNNIKNALDYVFDTCSIDDLKIKVSILDAEDGEVLDNYYYGANTEDILRFNRRLIHLCVRDFRGDLLVDYFNNDGVRDDTKLIERFKYWHKERYTEFCYKMIKENKNNEEFWFSRYLNIIKQDRKVK